MLNQELQTLRLNNDYEGQATATLITAKKNRTGQPAVLYLHGFIDYFFHEHLMERASSEGFNFYALELRKYGRSMLPHQHPNYCRNLHEYFEEITKAIEIILKDKPSKIIFLGHSTGGLTIPLYAAQGSLKDRVDLMVLNSPFLELNLPPVLRKLGVPILGFLGSLFPYAKLPEAVSPIYPKSIHKNYHGEWDFSTTFKPIMGFPAYFLWLKAIAHGQAEVKKGLGLTMPVLMMHSSDSFVPKKMTERVHKSDVVLNVNHMKDLAPKLGDSVTIMEIKDGIHDLFLSDQKVRKEAMDKMFSWLKSHL